MGIIYVTKALEEHSGSAVASPAAAGAPDVEIPPQLLAVVTSVLEDHATVSPALLAKWVCEEVLALAGRESAIFQSHEPHN
jgi:hypothetical protein